MVRFSKPMRSGLRQGDRGYEEKVNMPGCVLRVLGDLFEPERFLANTSLIPYVCFQKGCPAMSGNKPIGGYAHTSGFCCEVSAADASFEEQTRDAISFLGQHQKDLELLKHIDTLESAYLDFGYECRLNDTSVCVQGDFLPSELLSLAGNLGIGICLSLYPRLEDAESDKSMKM
jgi:hypothetical protein